MHTRMHTPMHTPRRRRPTPAERPPGRTRAVLLACVLLVGLVGPACRDNADDATPSGGPARSTLRVAVGPDDYAPGSGRPIGVSSLNANLTETLVRLTPDLTIEPLLAESWALAQPNTWRFTIRSGVTFHDGRPLTAALVKEGLFDRLVQQGGDGIGVTSEAVKVVDDRTLDFTPAFPNLRVPKMLAHPRYGVWFPGAEGAGPVGTGPFRFAEYKQGERLVVERFDGYWGEKARSQRIEFLFHPESADRIDALAKGRVDVAVPVPPQTASALETSGLETGAGKTGVGLSLYALLRGIPPHTLLSDPSVRKAVAQALNRDQIVSQALGGNAKPSGTHVPSVMLGPHAGEVHALPHDPGKARELLDAAGWVPGEDGIRVKGDRRLELTLVNGYPYADINQPVPTVIKRQLEAVGIAVRITQTRTIDDYIDALSTSSGDLFLEQGTQNDGNPAFLPLLLASGSGRWAVAFGPGSAYDAALVPAFQVAELDKAQAATAAALKVAIEQEAAVIPLVGIPRVYGWSPAVEGVVPHPSMLSARWDTAVFAGAEAE